MSPLLPGAGSSERARHSSSFTPASVADPDGLAPPAVAGAENYSNKKVRDFRPILQQQLVDTLARRGDVSYDLQIQVASNKEHHDVNDPTHQWPHAEVVTVGKLKVPQQKLVFNGESFVNEELLTQVGVTGGVTTSRGEIEMPNYKRMFNSKELLFSPANTHPAHAPVISH